MSLDRIEKLKSFLKENPKDCFLNHALALEYIKAEDDVTAKQYFDINMENDPNYIATYYHLGKLLERTGQRDEAVSIYEKGMAVAKKVNDNHTYNELQSAYEDLVY